MKVRLSSFHCPPAPFARFSRPCPNACQRLSRRRNLSRSDDFEPSCRSWFFRLRYTHPTFSSIILHRGVRSHHDANPRILRSVSRPESAQRHAHDGAARTEKMSLGIDFCDSTNREGNVTGGFRGRKLSAVRLSLRNNSFDRSRFLPPMVIRWISVSGPTSLEWKVIHSPFCKAVFISGIR
jgi:hypothetical protein